MRKNYSKKDIMELVKDEDVEFIRLQFTDMFGSLKNVAITASQLEKALNNECMFDGSSIEGFVRIEESDMYLHPDLSTMEIFPWRPQQGKVARLICDVYRPNGMPFEGDPRYILKRAIKEAEDLGYRFEVGPECEFFLFHTDENGMPTTLTHEKAGYFDLGPLDLGENARRDMVLTLEDMGFIVEASHHEVAPAQHEIDFQYDEALATADNIMTFKLAVKTIATNPLVNSYKRLVPGYEAPVYIAWSSTNRSPLIRIPASRGAGTRIELRCPDPSANPYLALAVCLRAGLDGIVNQIEPPASVDLNIFALSEEEKKKLGIEAIPGTLIQAVNELEKDELIRDVLGRHVSTKYIEAKKKEWENYASQVTDWEVNQYLNQY